MINLVLWILLLLAGLGLFAFGIYKAVKVIKNPMPGTINYKNEMLRLFILAISSAITFCLTFVFVSLYNCWGLSGLEWFSLMFGTLMFATSFEWFIYSFILHYYGKEIPERENKALFGTMIGSIVSFLCFFFVMTEGFAEHIKYPLIEAISFTEGFGTPFHQVKGFTITFYAIFILGGAILVYFICDHRFYKEYGKHGLLESTFYIAFPAGILGGRLGYVIGNWNGDPTADFVPFATRVANGEWWSIFAIWEGGLTIISGALIGIGVGVAWFRYKHKEYNLLFCLDIVAPTVLIAQAIGRWGNFFNAEVHGFQYTVEAFRWLPTIVRNNIAYSVELGKAAPGMVYLPLFFIEFLTNLAGYFLIRFGFGKGLRKYIEDGDLSALYFVWYGFTRILMEPLRVEEFKMGTKGYWSWFWAFFFVLGGALAIAANHIIRYLKARKNGNFIVLKNSFRNGIIASSVFAILGLALVIIGLVNISKGTYVPILDFNQFNNGIITLISGLSAICLLAVTLPHVIEGKKREK